MDENKIICWRLKDSEEGDSDTIADLICELEENERLEENISEEGTLEVTGYKKKKIDIKGFAEITLEDLTERLDEEIGLDDYTEVTEKMELYAERFVRDVLSEYTVYGLEEVVTKTIKVSEYRYDD